MSLDAKYLELSFDNVGVRNSQKRLSGLIDELAVQPLRQRFQDELLGDFERLEQVIAKRVAAVIVYWARHKHEPIKPELNQRMSDITNARKNDVTLETFYLSEVEAALHSLAPLFAVDVPDDYAAKADELELALLEMEEQLERDGIDLSARQEADPYDDYADDDYGDYADEDLPDDPEPVRQMSAPQARNGQSMRNAQGARQPEPERHIVPAQQPQIVEQQPAEIQLDVLNLNAEQAWHLIYGLIGYPSDYIQQTMLPRWQQYPGTFEQDRAFLYRSFKDAIQNYAGAQMIAGNYRFHDQPMTVDQLWQHYFADLSQQVAPQLAAARLQAAANTPWHRKLWQRFTEQLSKVSLIWLLALSIALIFDGLTTYISLDQTPMEGIIVPIFTVLITALFQIADQLVINYRKREFEAEALSAKFRAQYERLKKTLEQLAITSDSYVQLSMQKSQAHADWQAAEDNRKMARRGRFWSARIADINVVVTAYGFAYLFLNAEEPVYALIEQIDFIVVQNAWEQVDLWVFLMIGLAITVSFVVNTAQRTEILGWSMRRLKQE